MVGSGGVKQTGGWERGAEGGGKCYRRTRFHPGDDRKAEGSLAARLKAAHGEGDEQQGQSWEVEGHPEPKQKLGEEEEAELVV